MKPSDLTRLVHAAFWSKDIVLWIGSDAELEKVVQGVNVAYLDVLDLTDGEFPLEDTERSRVISTRLQKRLEELDVSTSEKLVLIVRNVGILSRHMISLNPFFELFGGVRRMAILSLRGESINLGVSQALSEQIVCEPDTIANYLVSCLADQHKVFRGNA